MKLHTSFLIILASLSVPSLASSGAAGETGTGTPYRVAVHEPKGADAWIEGLQAKNLEAAHLSDRQMADPDVLNPDAFDALLLPHGARGPILAKENLLQFLRGGGDLVVLGGPLFEDTLQAAQADWARTLQALPVTQSIIDFATDSR